MSCNQLDDFLRLLKESPSGAVFNPWWELDNDIDTNAPAIRRNQLRAYLEQRLGKASFAIIGEAISYRGGHFSGIPMTSERILLGKKRDEGIEPDQVFPASNRAVRANPSNVETVSRSRRRRLSGARCSNADCSLGSSFFGTRFHGTRSIRTVAC